MVKIGIFVKYIPGLHYGFVTRVNPLVSMLFPLPGEFGSVVEGHLKKPDGTMKKVAVKTMKCEQAFPLAEYSRNLAWGFQDYCIAGSLKKCRIIKSSTASDTARKEQRSQNALQGSYRIIDAMLPRTLCVNNARTYALFIWG